MDPWTRAVAVIVDTIKEYLLAEFLCTYVFTSVSAGVCKYSELRDGKNAKAVSCEVAIMLAQYPAFTIEALGMPQISVTIVSANVANVVVVPA